jgi:ADP-heptose:LPS heptosyltransferase
VVAAIEAELSPDTVNVARGHNLIETAGLLSEVSLYIGVDTGITHLAALVGAPTIALFGPTQPTLWRPIGPRVSVLKGNAGRDCCARDHPRDCAGVCMSELSFREVWDAAIAGLANFEPSRS